MEEEKTRSVSLIRIGFKNKIRFDFSDNLIAISLYLGSRENFLNFHDDERRIITVYKNDREW